MDLNLINKLLTEHDIYDYDNPELIVAGVFEKDGKCYIKFDDAPKGIVSISDDGKKVIF